jgi:hypothetical protein
LSSWVALATQAGDGAVSASVLAAVSFCASNAEK